MAVKKSDVVLETIRSLHDAGQVCSRDALEKITGLKMSVIDARIAYLVESGDVYRLERGVFIPAHNHPPTRVITATHLPDGAVSIEVGDDVLQLNPTEYRILGVALAGGAMQHTNVAAGYALTQTLGKIEHGIKQLTKMEPKDESRDENRF